LPDLLTYKRFGERAILIEWPAEISESTLSEILILKEKINCTSKGRILDFSIGYHSLTVVYAEFITNFTKEIEHIKSIESSASTGTKLNSKVWNIPVCYNEDLGIDLETVSKRLKLSKEDLINRHTKPLYRVYFIGFLPGFMYLGGLDKTLHMPRKDTPRLNVEKGSVGIGGSQTGIYPSDSAGGWNIIGKTPVTLFNVRKDQPTFVKAGDQIQFTPISLKEFKTIENDTRLKSQFFAHG